MPIAPPASSPGWIPGPQEADPRCGTSHSSSVSGRGSLHEEPGRAVRRQPGHRPEDHQAADLEGHRLEGARGPFLFVPRSSSSPHPELGGHLGLPQEDRTLDKGGLRGSTHAFTGGLDPVAGARQCDFGLRSGRNKKSRSRSGLSARPGNKRGGRGMSDSPPWSRTEPETRIRTALAGVLTLHRPGWLDAALSELGRVA